MSDLALHSRRSGVMLWCDPVTQMMEKQGTHTKYALKPCQKCCDAIWSHTLALKLSQGLGKFG